MHNLPHRNQVIWKSIKKKINKSFDATTLWLNANKRQGWAEKTKWTYLCKITQTACLQHTNRSCHIPATKVRKRESIIFLHWSAGFQCMPSFLFFPPTWWNLITGWTHCSERAVIWQLHMKCRTPAFRYNTHFTPAEKISVMFVGKLWQKGLWDYWFLKTKAALYSSLLCLSFGAYGFTKISHKIVA